MSVKNDWSAARSPPRRVICGATTAVSTICTSMTAPIRYEFRPTRSTGSVLSADANDAYGIVVRE